MRALILEDEENNRITLKSMLNDYCPDIQVVAEASNKQEGLAALLKHQPELLLLDIQIEQGTSFELLQEINTENYYIIFITAFNNYAIDAFKYSALDYLLKPINPDELIEAIEKVKSLHRLKGTKSQVDLLLTQMHENTTPKKIVLKTAKSIHLVAIDDIIRCEAQGNYCTFFMADNEKIMVSKTLKDFSPLLINNGFYRAHQAHLINLKHIKRYDKADGGSLIMKDNSQLPVAVRKKGELFNILTMEN